MKIGQRVKLVRIHERMNPILKKKINQDGRVILLGLGANQKKVLVKFDKPDVAYGEWWVGCEYLEEVR